MSGPLSDLNPGSATNHMTEIAMYGMHCTCLSKSDAIILLMLQEV